MRRPTDFTFQRFHVDLAAGSVRHEEVTCADTEDVLGGVGRAFKLLAGRGMDDAYHPDALLVMNLGLLSGSEYMTGLRTFFSAYSPLKCSRGGKPGAMWSTGSGKLGTKLRALGVDEALFAGRCATPTLLHISPEGWGLCDARDLVGLRTGDRIQLLHERYPDAHFAVVGPAGEAWQNVRYAAIAMSTVNQLQSGEPKSRFAGRGGMGGVMGSKNLLAIVADGPDPQWGGAPPVLKELNREVARGPGSARFRDAKRGGAGGTWANVAALDPVGAMPEMNFLPTGDPRFSLSIHRDSVEAGPYVVKDEACFRCGIRCHKNVHAEGDGRFLAKLDYEPLTLLSSNLGITDVDQACELIELVDQLGLDSISVGVVLSYVMEHNRRHPGADLAGGLSYGDFEGVRATIEAIGDGRLPELGQGVSRLAQATGETAYAMQSKGLEYPAYLPQTNPGYPFALAGGHMSMRTYLLLLHERETGLDYWVDAITGRGLQFMRDDLVGLCKFAGATDDQVVTAIRALTELDLEPESLQEAVLRTYLRGYALERAQGFAAADYAMPAVAHEEHEAIQLPHFSTPEFFARLRDRVLARFDELAAERGIT